MKRIIIADPDLSYLVKLQVKFLQKLQESYEIDIISEEEYLEEFLDSPQSAVCIVVNEEWLSKDLNRHDFSYIIALTEGGITMSSADLKVERNTNPEEIFNQIRNLIGFHTETTSKLESATVLFKSAKGGTGKTVLSLALAHYLAKKYYRVLYINTQALQTFQYYLKDKYLIPNEIAIDLQSQNDIYKILEKYIKKDSFSYLPPFEMLLHSYGINKNLYTSFIKGAKESKTFDFIIIDSDNDIDINTAEHIALADRIMVVTNPGEDNIFSLDLFLKKINVNSEKVTKLCNMSDSPTQETDDYITKYEEELNSENIEEFAKTKDIKRIALAISQDIV